MPVMCGPVERCTARDVGHLRRAQRPKEARDMPNLLAPGLLRVPPLDLKTPENH